MLKSKKYFYDSDRIYDGDEELNGETLAQEIVDDPELPTLESIVIGCWGEAYDNSAQSILDKFVENQDKFQQIQELFIGDMEYDECEVSWIVQGDYSPLLAALPNLKSLTIKGSDSLELGNVDHQNLESLEIICGGLPTNVINSITNGKLPSLKKLNLYLGVDDYGFDGSINDIKTLLKAPFISKLEYLGLCDSDIQDEVVEAFLDLGTTYNIKTLDFSKGTLSDKGGQLILDNVALLKSVDTIDLSYHYLSNDMMDKLSKCGLNINLAEQNKDDTDGEDVWRYPMITE